ncbi:hypothetical protein ABPG74_005067 [Tetrahymena malaccensis]
MGQNITLGKSVILYEFVQNVIKKKCQKDCNNFSVECDSNTCPFAQENKQLKESVKEHQEMIETLRKELQKYSSSILQLQDQACQLDCKYFQDICKIIDCSQKRLLKLLDQQNAPKNNINGNTNMNFGKYFQDDQSQQVLKTKVESLFLQMKLAIESLLLDNRQKIMPQIYDDSDNSQDKCILKDVFYGKMSFFVNQIYFLIFICTQIMININYQDNNMQSSGENVSNLEDQLNSYQKLNQLNNQKQELDLEGNNSSNQQIQSLSGSQQKQLINKIGSSCQNLQINRIMSEQNFTKKVNKNIKIRSQTQFDKQHSKQNKNFDNSLLEDFENSSGLDFMYSEDKDQDSETSISIPKKMSYNNSKQNQAINNTLERGEFNFQQIMIRNEVSLTTIENENVKDNQNIMDTKNKKDGNQLLNHQYFKTEKVLKEKQRDQDNYYKKQTILLQKKTGNKIVSNCMSKNFSNFSQKSFFYIENLEKKLQSQTNLKLNEQCQINNYYTQSINMDFCSSKVNKNVLKIIDKVDENNFFSDEVVRYSSNKKTERIIIVLNSLNFYVFSQDLQEKHKQFLIEDISKILLCPSNKHLCSVQIQKQFQLIIEVPHTNFFIKHIQRHFKNILKKNPPEIKVQKTKIYTDYCNQNNRIAKKYIEEYASKYNLSASGLRSQLKSDSAQLNLYSQLNVFILKNPNNLQQSIDYNWVKGHLILEENKNISTEQKQMFELTTKLKVQADTDCFISNQTIFKFSDQEKNIYYIKLNQDFDIPILIKNIKSGYQPYLNLYNYINS